MRPRNPKGRIVHSFCYLTDKVSSVRYIPPNRTKLKVHKERTLYSLGEPVNRLSRGDTAKLKAAERSEEEGPIPWLTCYRKCSTLGRTQL